MHKTGSSVRWYLSKYFIGFTFIYLSFIFFLLKDFLINFLTEGSFFTNLEPLEIIELVISITAIIILSYYYKNFLRKFIVFSSYSFNNLTNKELRVIIYKLFFSGKRYKNLFENENLKFNLTNVRKKLSDPLHYTLYVMLIFLQKLQRLENMFNKVFKVIERFEYTKLDEKFIKEQEKIYDDILLRYDEIVKTIIQEQGGFNKATEEIKKSFNILLDNKQLFHDIDFIATNINAIFEEMIATIKSISELSTKAQEDRKLIEKTIEKSIKNILSVLNNVGKVSDMLKQMYTIFDLIDDIHEKINILGINSAIEASKIFRVKGGGFRVIAENIRKLSDESKKNFDDLKYRFKRIEEDLQNFLEESKTSNKYVNEINFSVNKVFNSFSEIDRAINEEFKSIEGLNTIFDELNQNTTKMKDDITNLMKFNEYIRGEIEKNQKVLDQIVENIFSLSTDFTLAHEQWSKLMENLRLLVTLKNLLREILEELTVISQDTNKLISRISK